MCHTYLAQIIQEKEDLLKIKRCNECDDFKKGDFIMIGICGKREIPVSRFQQCPLER